MAAWGYESYLLVLKVSLTSELRSLMRDTKTNFTLRRFYSLNFSMFSTYSGACMYMYIYIYIERERERERGKARLFPKFFYTFKSLKPMNLISS